MIVNIILIQVILIIFFCNVLSVFGLLLLFFYFYVFFFFIYLSISFLLYKSYYQTFSYFIIYRRNKYYHCHTCNYITSNVLHVITGIKKKDNFRNNSLICNIIFTIVDNSDNIRVLMSSFNINF